MVQEDRWREIHRMAHEEQLPIAETARRLDLDRKTVRRCLKQETWRPYQRPARTDCWPSTRIPARARAGGGLLGTGALPGGPTAWLLGCGYDTARRFVQPLRAVESLAERASVRFETPPGQQSQIDWGSARVHFRHQPVVLHLFVLTLGYSRRRYMEPALNERGAAVPRRTRAGVRSL